MTIPRQLKPTGWGLIAVLLGLVVAVASQCQNVINSIEKEPEIEMKGAVIE